MNHVLLNAFVGPMHGPVKNELNSALYHLHSPVVVEFTAIIYDPNSVYYEIRCITT